MAVKLKDVIDALEEAGYGHPHYLDRRTGEIFLMEDFCLSFEDREIGEDLLREIKEAERSDGSSMRSTRWKLKKPGTSFAAPSSRDCD